ncbi:MAG: NADH-quinone oxidoreductase subunit NuoN [Methylibium sp.]|uniref:NADH-quinone oxidoreductase subunit NuoN n=1 Tax=unclassified Methylibium TaxID=2633235 RepID=UPI0006FEDB08|nr:NADH-quinone oxidoreductase subunit NuoN [Methylibium sp. Root1272]KQW67968.1 NADH:ubiquinone oxidoreductase subunit N [Methylibium sp. Root1272]MDP1791204.1 NADH-quinone oxidoreductase subunit NuoN [Methylibium sp.]
MNDMNWLAVYPEILLLAMTCVIALVDLYSQSPKRTLTYALSLGTLVAVAVMHLSYFRGGFTLYAMQGMVVADPMGHLLAFFATVATFITLVYARPYAADRELLKGELFTLALFSLLGISIMISANNFLVVYLGLELMSLSLYALVALRRDHAVSTEAAMKYFVLGALASGFLLYGLSMMYGATGSLDLGEVFKAIGTGQINQQVLVFGVVFVVAGLGFKLGVVPFHMWVPDVYQGAPTAITLMIAGAPKLAAFAITIRLLVEGMIGLALDWQQMLIVLSVASMVIGNLAAIAQSNLKRMLAYSAIAQLGFMLLGLTPTVISGNTFSAANGYSSAMFYLVTYLLTTLCTFGVVMVLARQGFEAEEIDDLRGLNQRNPLLAAIMGICMFSLAGIPPAVGFYAKLAVLQALVSTNVTGYIVLAIVAVMLSLVGAFYYLRIVKTMYFDEPVAGPALVVAPTEVRVLLSLNGAAVLVFGLLPGGLMTLCADAIRLALAT